MEHADPRKGIIYASLTALLWGLLAIALKVALYDLSPLTIVWMRFSISFLFLSIFVLATDKSLFKILKKPGWPLVLAALFLSLNYIGFVKGVQYTSPSVAQVYIQLGPVLLAFSGIFIYKERITRLQLAGILIVILGLFVFYLEQITNMFKNSEAYNDGVIWVIFGAITWSIYAVIQKKLVQNQSTNQMNLIIYGLPTLLFFILADFGEVQRLTFAGWMVLLFLGLNTLFAYTFIVLALKYLDANKVSVIITLNPIITFILMAILTFLQVEWIGHEHFSIWGFVGAAMVLSGAAIAILFSGRKTKKNKVSSVVK